MSDRLLVATRKGLFTLERNGTNSATPWKITRTEFMANTVWIVYPDNRNGHVYAAIGHGHFGQKLHRSADGGANWEECAPPKYPDPPAGAEDDLCPMRRHFAQRRFRFHIRLYAMSCHESAPCILLLRLACGRYEPAEA